MQQSHIQDTAKKKFGNEFLGWEVLDSFQTQKRFNEQNLFPFLQRIVAKHSTKIDGVERKKRSIEKQSKLGTKSSSHAGLSKSTGFHTSIDARQGHNDNLGDDGKKLAEKVFTSSKSSSAIHKPGIIEKSIKRDHQDENQDFIHPHSKDVDTVSHDKFTARASFSGKNQSTSARQAHNNQRETVMKHFDATSSSKAAKSEKILGENSRAANSRNVNKTAPTQLGNNETRLEGVEITHFQ